MTSLPTTYLVPCLGGALVPSNWRTPRQSLAAFTCDSVTTRSRSNSSRSARDALSRTLRSWKTSTSPNRKGHASVLESRSLSTEAVSIPSALTVVTLHQNRSPVATAPHLHPTPLRDARCGRSIISQLKAQTQVDAPPWPSSRLHCLALGPLRVTTTSHLARVTNAVVVRISLNPHQHACTLAWAT